MTTLRQIEANRQNAQKSTGPKTIEGKANSRRSALKHGMAGNGIVFPDEVDQRIADRVRDWGAELKPRNNVEVWYVEQVAAASVCIDRCKAQQTAAWNDLSYRAENFWDDDRRRDAEKLAKRLPKDPGLVRLELESTKQGCELIIERWELLLVALEDGEPWNDAMRAMALDLLGVHPDLRGSRSRIDPKPGIEVVEHQSNVAKGQIERLSLQRDNRLDDSDAKDRDLALMGLSVPNREIMLIVRYEFEARRRMLKALDLLQKGRRHSDDSRTSAPVQYQPPPPPEAPDRQPPKKMRPEAEHAVHPDTPLTTREAFFDALGKEYDIDRAMAKVKAAGKWDEWFGNLLKSDSPSQIPVPPGAAPGIPGVNCRIIQPPAELYDFIPVSATPRPQGEPRRGRG
jgi:hypothetical protein